MTKSDNKRPVYLRVRATDQPVLDNLNATFSVMPGLVHRLAVWDEPPLPTRIATVITAQDIINRKDEWFNEGSYVGEPWSFVNGSIDEAVLSSLITDAIRAATTYMTSPWIPVTEQLPPADPMSGTNYHSIPVHIFWREDEPMICTGVYAFKRKRWYTVPYDDDSHPVTHWTPLIPPPK